MKEILIINQPWSNRGDEAAHRSLMRALDKEFLNVHFTVLFMQLNDNDISELIVKSDKITYINITGFSRGIDFLQRWTLRFNIPCLSLLHPTISKYAKHIKNASLIVCAPGGIDMGGNQCWGHIFTLTLAKYFKKKLVYYSRSFGPFPIETTWNRVFKKISLQLLNSFDFLSIRDGKTMELAEKLDLKYIPSIDTAFLDTPNAEIPKEISYLIGKDKYVVFVPNSLTWHKTYKDVEQKKIDDYYINILQILLSSKGKVIMLPQLTSTVPYSEPDYDYFLKLKKGIGNDNIIVIDDTYSSDIQQKIIAKSEYVIGARYHSIVFAINNAVPFISLSYEYKMTGLLKILDLLDREINLLNIGKNNFDAELSLQQIKQLLNNNYQNTFNAKEQANKIAFETFEKLKKCIESSI